MSKIKIIHKKLATGGWLNELTQSMTILFSFVVDGGGNKMKQIIVPCKCRDFLGDMLWSKHKNTMINIYGMSYNHADSPYDEDHLKLSMKFPDGGALNNFMENVPKFLHKKEEEAGVELTQILQTEENDTIVVIASPLWQSTVWKISLYSFYLKLCAFEDPDAPPEGTYEKQYRDGLSKTNEEILLSNVTDDLVWFHDSPSTNHNYSGFVSLVRWDIRYTGENPYYTKYFKKKRTVKTKVAEVLNAL